MIRYKYAVALSVVVATGACAQGGSNFDQMEIHRSATQTLVLTNGGGGVLVVEPNTDGIPPLTVPSGASERIAFEVLSVTQIEIPEGGTRFRKVAGTERNLVEGSEPAGYLAQPDLDATLRIGAPNAPPDEWRLSLNACLDGGWAARSAESKDHIVDISSPPLPGTPLRLCP